MRFTAAFAALGLAASAQAQHEERTFAVLRFTNKFITECRADPIVSPGSASAHLHTVHGGSNFGFGSSGEDLMQSDCTNAEVVGDHSAYWFPTLFFEDPSTSQLKKVPIFYTNIYYFFEKTHDDIEPFPVGLHIISGDPDMRTSPSTTTGNMNLSPDQGDIQPCQWTCPRSSNNGDAYPQDSDGSMAGIRDSFDPNRGIGFPFVNCDGFASPLRADIHFPSCYNPDAGLTNYGANMVFPNDAGNGYQDCPEGFIHVPHMFYEVYWDTPSFAGQWNPNQGSQPFVLSTGDRTGFGSHADFLAAWDTDVLQHIIDTCDVGSTGMRNCPGVTVNTNDQCSATCEADDADISEDLDGLPGNNPIVGWGRGSNADVQHDEGADEVDPDVNTDEGEGGGEVDVDVEPEETEGEGVDTDDAEYDEGEDEEEVTVEAAEMVEISDEEEESEEDCVATSTSTKISYVTVYLDAEADSAPPQNDCVIKTATAVEIEKATVTVYVDTELAQDAPPKSGQAMEAPTHGGPISNEEAVEAPPHLEPAVGEPAPEGGSYGYEKREHHVHHHHRRYGSTF